MTATSYSYYPCSDIAISNGAVTHRYYVRDYLGSVRAVFDLYGNLEQTNDYNVTGIPSSRHLGNADVHKHTGKEFQGFNGLAWYDNNARYYDPILARFTTHDPLAEKYPWLSPYNHCANNPLRNIDINGDSVTVLIAPKDAGNFGHLAILIQKPNGKWSLWSKNGTNENYGIYGEPNNDQINYGNYDSPQDFLNSKDNPFVDSNNNTRRYTEGFIISSTFDEDRQAETNALKEFEKDYFVIGSNCAKVVQQALNGAKKNDGSLSFWGKITMGTITSLAIDKTPRLIYYRIKQQNNGTVIHPN